MLPTASRLLLTCPDLYLDDLCPHCLQMSENADHLWQCQHSHEAVQRIRVEGCHLFWDLAVAACSSLRTTRSTGIFPGPHSIIDAVRGIVPLEWVVTLQASGIPLAKARSIASKVGVYFVTTAHWDIWQPHCCVQVAHEHSLLVTQKAKTHGRVCVTQSSHCIRLKPHCTHISHALAGFCKMCQLSFVDHHEGICPPLLSQAPFLADSLVQMHHCSLCILLYSQP